MYVVLAKSDKYPQLLLVKKSVMSQWGEPLLFPTKEDARAEASEWAGLFGGEDRKIVVRAAKEHPAVPFPARIAVKTPTRIIRRK